MAIFPTWCFWLNGNATSISAARRFTIDGTDEVGFAREMSPYGLFIDNIEVTGEATLTLHAPAPDSEAARKLKQLLTGWPFDWSPPAGIYTGDPDPAVMSADEFGDEVADNYRLTHEVRE